MVKKLHTKYLKNHHLKNDIAFSILMHTNIGKYSRTALNLFNDMLLTEEHILPL